MQRLRSSEMRKHPSLKPTAKAAIGRGPHVLACGNVLRLIWFHLFLPQFPNFVFPSCSSCSICVSRYFSVFFLIFCPFCLILNYNLSLLVLLFAYRRMGWSRRLRLSSPWLLEQCRQHFSASLLHIILCSVYYSDVGTCRSSMQGIREHVLY